MAGPVLAVLAVLTMTVGNLVALRQRRMVRLLAWSSVAQAGYILAPLGVLALAAGRTRTRVGRRWPPPSAYTVFYVLLELAAFGAVVGAARGGRDGGDARRLPGRGPAPRRGSAAAFVLALAGLAGLPPGLAGLFAKVDRGPGAARRRRRLAGRGGGAQRRDRPGLLRAGRRALFAPAGSGRSAPARVVSAAPLGRARRPVVGRRGAGRGHARRPWSSASRPSWCWTSPLTRRSLVAAR